MIWQTFTIQMVRYGGWPVVALVLGIIFKWPILGFIRRITEFSAFGIKAKLGKLAKEAKPKAPSTSRGKSTAVPSIDPTIANEAPTPTELTQDLTRATLTTLLAIAPSAPRAAAETAWELLVAELRGILATRLVTVNMLLSPYAMSLMLLNTGDLKELEPPPDKLLPDVIADAQSLAGRIGNGAKIDGDQAVSYVNAIGDIITRIRLSRTRAVS